MSTPARPPAPGRGGEERPLIVMPDDFPPAVAGTDQAGRLRALGELRIYDSLPASPQELVERIRHAHTVINVRASTLLTAEVLGQCRALRHIAVYGIGTDNVDVEAARARGIAVTNTPGYSAIAVAEATLALMLAAVRRIPQNDRAVRQGGWSRSVVGQLHGKTLGVLGAGPIAARVMELGRCLGMRVIAWTFNPSPERAQRLGVTFVELDDLLRAADVVSLHLPLSERSRGLLGRRELALLKPSAVLVNTGRGAVLDEEALVEALREGRIVAGLDVFTREPLPAGHPLTALDNVVLSPHNAPQTPETQYAGLVMTVDNIEGFLTGGPVHRVV